MDKIAYDGFASSRGILNRVMTVMLLGFNYTTSLKEIMRAVCEGIGVDRGAVMELVNPEDENLRTTYYDPDDTLTEEEREEPISAKTLIDEAELGNLDEPLFVDNIEEYENLTYIPRNSKSFVRFTLLDQGEPYGSVFFTCTQDAHEWTEDEKQLLAEVNTFVNSYISHQRLEKQLGESERSLKVQKEHYDYALEVSGAVFWIKNFAKDTLIIGDSVKEVLGYDPSFFKGKLSNLEALMLGSFKAITHQAKIDYTNGLTDSYYCDYSIYAADGSVKWMRSKGKFLSDGDKDEIYGTIVDVTNLKEYEAHLAELAYHDVLTDVYNVQYLSHGDSLPEKDGPKSLGALLVDIKTFKRINDVYGHEAGDQILQAVAKILQEIVFCRLVARVSADRFFVVYDDLDTQSLVDYATALLKYFETPISVPACTATLELKIGIVTMNGKLDMMELLKNAEIALSCAKKQDTPDYCVLTDDILNSIEMRSGMEDKMKKAIRKAQFVMFYQPKVSVREKKVVAAEALIRWQHPEMGMVPPVDFIPLAEESGMILPIGEFIIWDVIRQNSEWYHKGIDIMVSVNLSVKQFSNPKLVDYIIDTLEAFKLPCSNLSVEIVESVMVADFIHIRKDLEKLRSCGIKVELDDFGTGYSAMSYLTRLPIDFIKIDKSYVDHVDERAQDHAIMEAIILMAHRLGFLTIAEGVETESQLHVLERFGCDLIQGYYYSRPLKSEDFYKMVVEWDLDKK